MEQDFKIQELMRKNTKEARNEAKLKAMSQRRIGFDEFLTEEKKEHYSFEVILSHCRDSRFSDTTWLELLKKALYAGEIGSFLYQYFTLLIIKLISIMYIALQIQTSSLWARKLVSIYNPSETSSEMAKIRSKF